MSRVDPSIAQYERLVQKNSGRCCVCKRKGIGLNLHHIDGNNANTIDENLAVLCVEDHDHHHRPNRYSKTKHLELSANEIKQKKESWEAFVCDARSENPSVIAVINAFGDENQIHAAKIIFQWPDERIEFERTFHLLEGNFDYWTDEMMSEVCSIGQNIKITLIDEPLPVEYCPCCGNGFSSTVKEGVVIRSTNPNWKTESIMSIYINPNNPSLAVSVGIKDKHLFSASIHKCKGTHIHFESDYVDERIEIKSSMGVRTQVSKLVNKIRSEWHTAYTFIGTGDDEHPTIINEFQLPEIWEK